MRQSRKVFCAIVLATVGSFGTAYYARGYSYGITQRTLKTNRFGCSCHGDTPNSATTVTIAPKNGETLFAPGQKYTFIATVSNPASKAAGINIAAKHGTLTPIGSSLYVGRGAELAHAFPNVFAASSSMAQWTFQYTVPSTGLTDTIYATGNAVNLDQLENIGDAWNFAPNFIVNIGLNSVAEQQRTSPIQIYPNPVRDHVSISIDLSTADRLTLEVSDASGKLIKTTEPQTQAPGHQNLNLPTSELPQGSYLLRVVGERGVIAETRFVVLR